MYRLLDSSMDPFFRCSWMNSFRATCSGLVRVYIFPGIVLRAPSFRSIAWSHIQEVENCCDSFSLNTLAYGLY